MSDVNLELGTHFEKALYRDTILFHYYTHGVRELARRYRCAWLTRDITSASEGLGPYQWWKFSRLLSGPFLLKAVDARGTQLFTRTYRSDFSGNCVELVKIGQVLMLPVELAQFLDGEQKKIQP